MAENLHGEALSKDDIFTKKLQFVMIADKMKNIYRQTLLVEIYVDDTFCYDEIKERKKGIIC